MKNNFKPNNPVTSTKPLKYSFKNYIITLKQTIFIHFPGANELSSVNLSWNSVQELEHVLSQLAREGRGLPQETKMAPKTFHDHAKFTDTLAYLREIDGFLPSEIYF